MIAAGEKVPNVSVMQAKADGPEPLSTEDYLAGKKTVLFAVPGAYTPTCSARHLPGFVEQAEALRAKGVDQVACISVNDGFVMQAWGEQAGAAGKVDMLADGNGEFAKAVGLELDATGFGMGQRSQRYAMIIEDGVAKTINVEEGGAFEVSSVEHVLSQL